MLDAQLGVEDDAVPGAAQAGPELDVLDGGAAVALVEAAEGEEDRATDRAAAAPEGARLAPPVLVDEAVQQVLVLRDEVGLARLVVVGADQRIQLALAREGGADAARGVPADQDVGVDEEEDVAPRRARAERRRKVPP